MPEDRTSHGRSEVIQLSVAYLLYFTTQGIFLPYFPVYMTSRGLTGVEIGWLFAVGPLMRIAIPPLLGFVSDRSKGPQFWSMITAWGSLAGLLVISLGSAQTWLIAGIILYFIFTAPSIPLL